MRESLLVLISLASLLSSGCAAKHTAEPVDFMAGAYDMPASDSSRFHAVTTPDNDVTVVPATPIDINTATADELHRLPGIDLALAQRIVAYRGRAGTFTSPGDLLQVNGMTRETLRGIEPWITINGAIPPQDPRQEQWKVPDPEHP